MTGLDTFTAAVGTALRLECRSQDVYLWAQNIRLIAIPVDEVH